MGIRSFLFNKKSIQTKIEENNVQTESVLDLLNSLSPFTCDGDHSEEIQDFETKIEIIYKNLIISLLNGDFLTENSYKNILYKLDDIILGFDNQNFNKDSEYIRLVKSPLQIMCYDMKSISRVQILINNRRKKIYNLDRIPKYKSEREEYMKLLSIIIDILVVERHIIEGDLSLMFIIIRLGEDIKTLQFTDESFLFFKEILLERIEYDLYKFSKVYGDDIAYYREEIEEKDFGKIKDNSRFCDVKSVLNFLYHPESGGYFVSEKEEKNKLEKSKFGNMLSFNRLITYYKDRVESLDGLEEIIEKYAEVFNLEPTPTNEYYINYVYAKNNYLSLLINTFENKRNSDKEKQQIENKINDIFNELTFHKRKKHFRNYFTYFKYARYKYISSLNYKRLGDLEKAKDEIKQASVSIMDAINIFENDSFYDYFEYDRDSNIFTISKDTECSLDRLYVCNLYSLPFNRQEKKKILEELQKKILKLEIDIITSEKFKLVDEKINNYKIDTMGVLGIFTGIVVYSFGTIQIFSIIENIGDAIMFSGIFLSGILLLLFGVFFYKEEIKKARCLFIASIIVLVLSIVGRYFLKDSPININKGENTYNKLEDSIYKATLLEESLEKMLKESSCDVVNESKIKDN